jgi:hypothetical protein
MRIIGLTGEARAGKDTVAQIIRTCLTERAGLSDSVRATVLVTGFAHKLKLSAARLFYPEATLEEALEWSDWFKTYGGVELYDSRKAGERVVTGRAFLQRYGTEAHRNTFGEDFWLDAVLPAERADCDTLVICDARFENEVQRIRDRGGEVWRILRPGHENPAEVGAHASEQRIPDQYVDKTIVNDSEDENWREALRGKVLEAL